MIIVTEDAKEELKRISPQNGGQPETVLRLVAYDGGQLGLVADNVREGDQSVKWQDEAVLVIDKGLLGTLEEVIIDCRDTEKGRHLALIGCMSEEAKQKVLNIGKEHYGVLREAVRAARLAT